MMQRLLLRALILMMRESEIGTAAMDINLLTEILIDHHNALGMPTRSSFSPRAVPLDALVCLLP